MISMIGCLPLFRALIASPRSAMGTAIGCQCSCGEGLFRAVSYLGGF